MTIASKHPGGILNLGGEVAPAKQMELLMSATQTWLKARDSAAMMASLGEIITGHVKADGYLAYSLDDGGSTATLDAWGGIPDEVVPALRRLERADALCDASISAPEQAPDQSITRANDPKTAAMRRAGHRVFFCYALTVGERCLGVLSVGAKTRGPFARDEIAFIRAMCDYAAMAMERLRLLHEIRRREETLLRAQRAAKAGWWEIDLRTSRLTWSEAYYELFALDHHTEPSIAAWLARIHPDDRQHVKAQYDRAIAEEREQDFEYRILLPGGAVRWVNRKGHIDRDSQGRPVR